MFIPESRVATSSSSYLLKGPSKENRTEGKMSKQAQEIL